jgi:CheY-like chemotaxis protein
LARKILLADDSVTAQNMGRKILADAGYEVITVNNGSAALKKIAELKPDLIILDVYMPGYSGLEVCQRLKEVQETSRIPVLLTVGKLEPFKPEEAKRVRAEGYIVKPFEASELLAALAKLEDKIVPRGEASKPGRFARANAALDEGRYDKTVVVDEDSGWKNRIGFPSKKKKAVEEEDGDDPAIYNAINKDLRTVVEHKPARSAHEAKQQEDRVDLGALAPEGLPKDVTPEEIAALAAAAAQVKGKLGESAVAEHTPEHAFATPAEAKAEEAKTAEEKPQAKEDIAAELPQETTAATGATFAEQKSEERVADSTEKSREAASLAAPSPAEMMAAIAGLVPESANAQDTSSGNGSASQSTDHLAPNQPASSQPADEPVTMAVAAGAEFAVAASRWMAVPVALAADEATISLEHEMQKAYAAFAAAETAPAGFLSTIPEIPPVNAEPAAAIETLSPVEAITPELVGPVPPTPESEIAQAASGLSGTTEAIAAAMREFETVAVAQVESQPSAPAEPARVQTAEPVAQPESEASQIVEAKPAEPAAAEMATSQSEVAALEPAQHDVPEPVQEERHEEEREEESKFEEPKSEPAPVVTAAAEEGSAITPEQPESTAPTFVNEAPGDQTSFSQVSSGTAGPAPTDEPAAGSTREMGKKEKESEIAETTAAAWASWRRIRESGDSKATPGQSSKQGNDAEQETPTPQDTAAMAVAAGAEKTPEEASAASEDSGEIASIVDSVLAEMRPKIVAEISKKMGKKK